MSRKNLLILLLPMLMLACKALFPEPAPKQAPVIAPTTQARKTPIPRPAASTAPSAAEPGTPAADKSDFTIVRLHPEDGELTKLLATEAQKADELGQLPVVEFDATWCPPCQAIEASLKEKNELMLAAFAGTYIIRLDVDEWGWEMGKYGFEFDGIPVYFNLDSNGKPTGKVIDGNAWGDNIPENMAPPLDKFFHGN